MIPTPFSVRDLIPARYRKIIYSVLAAVNAVEVALDAAGWGFVSSEVQGKFAIFAGVLGFTLASVNTR